MPDIDLKKIDSLRTQGKSDEALKTLEQSGNTNSAEYQYARGRILEELGRHEEATEAYEQALRIRDDFGPARFRLGYVADLRGDEDKAVDCYEKCVARAPHDVASLLNLGTLYEERGYVDPLYYDKAIDAYKRVLDINPNHMRARLALRDAQAAKVMFYDEEQERRRDRRNQVLEIPVTDFELSVRSRNCLKKMNVRSLGDLIMHSEQDLLGYKNFGETSLAEIKEMLTQKGLYLGMGLEQAPKKRPMLGRSEPVAAPVAAPQAAPVNETELLPIEAVEFSVRSRKAFQRLGIQTLGELASRSEPELMSIKNFGQTSLTEVKQKLRRYGLSLREE